MLLYHGGTIFGRAANNTSHLANAVLGIMIDCMYGGPRMIPVAKLTSEFLSEQVNGNISSIKSAGGSVRALICDDNRTNQKFLKSFQVAPNKPWRTIDNVFLLFDYVHLTKSIRNNWITEKTRELVFEDNGIKKTAKWAHLLALYKAESKNPYCKLSNLNEAAVMPKNTEKQSVPLCLRVFCDETATALLTHSEVKDVPGVSDTALFIQKVVTFWKIVNVKYTGADVRQNDYLKGAIFYPNDDRLELLLNFGRMCLQMISRPRFRVKQLTRDTSLAVHQTCFGLVDLARYLLASSHVFVCLGKFTTDKLEKAYSKLRQGSGGTYFITVQQVIEKLNIQKTKLLLQTTSSIDNLPEETGHQCSQCDYNLDEEGSEIFDNIANLENSITIDTKMALVYIAGYVTRKDSELTESELLDVTTFYFGKYGEYTDNLDRGGLNIPNDSACQWTFFSYSLFVGVKDKVCRSSLSLLLTSKKMADNGHKHGRH